MHSRGNWNRLAAQRFTRRQMLGHAARAGVGGAGLALVGCGDDDDQQTASEAPAAAELRSTSYAFPFGAPFAGLLPDVYSAVDRGYFREEGFADVDLIYQTALVPLLVGGTVDYGFPTTVDVLNAFSADRPLTAVFQSTYAFVFGIRVPADSDITEFTADQFRGKTIGITEFVGGEVPMLRAMMKREGLVEAEDVTLLATSGTTQQPTVDALNTGKIAAFAASHIDFAAIETAGLPLRDITPVDIRDRMPASNVIGVRKQFLEENRDEVVRFSRAVAKGIIFTLENRPAAAEIGLKFAPESGDIPDIVEFIDLFLTNRIEPPPGVQYGAVAVDGWKTYMDFLLQGSTGSETDPLNFDEPIDVSEVIDNTLVSEIMNFDQERIRAEARAFTA